MMKVFVRIASALEGIGAILLMIQQDRRADFERTQEVRQRLHGSIDDLNGAREKLEQTEWQVRGMLAALQAAAKHYDSTHVH